MAEGLLARARRVVEAGVGSVVETAERLSGASLMRQAIRDVAHAVDDVKKRQGQARKQALQAGERKRLADDRAAKLREEARFALVAGRDDLAQAALFEKQTAEAHAESAAVAQTSATEQAQRLEEALADLLARQRMLEEELRSHEAIVGGGGQVLPPRVDRKVHRAEESFARALATTGAGPTIQGSGVAEIEAMRREKAVADELASLRTGLDAPTPAPRRARRG